MNKQRVDMVPVIGIVPALVRADTVVFFYLSARFRVQLNRDRPFAAPCKVNEAWGVFVIVLKKALKESSLSATRFSGFSKLIDKAA